MLLPELFDLRMIVALRAFEVETKEQPGHILRDDVHVAIAVEVEPGGPAIVGVGTVVRENLPDELIPRLIGGERLAEELFPLGHRDVFLRQAAHQPEVELPLHVPGVLGSRQQPVDQLGALARALVGEERARVGGGGDRPGQVEPGAAQELGVIGEWGGEFVVVGGLEGNQPVDLRGERLLSGDFEGRGQQQAQPQQAYREARGRNRPNSGQDDCGHEFTRGVRNGGPRGWGG